MQALLMFLVRVFFATHDTKNPFLSTLIASLLAVPAVWLLGVNWGVFGIALAMSLAAWLNGLYLLLMLRKKLGAIDFQILRLSVWRGLQLGLITALPGGAVYYLVGWLVTTESSLVFVLQVLSAGLVSLLSLFIAIYFFRLVDFREIWSQARADIGELTGASYNGTK